GSVNNVWGVPVELEGGISYMLTGDATGLYGPATGVTGDIETCNLTLEDRQNGVNILSLVGSGKLKKTPNVIIPDRPKIKFELPEYWVKNRREIIKQIELYIKKHGIAS